MTKKDDGIAKLSNGLLIPEETRDKLIKHDWSKPRNLGWNPDNATSKELEEKRWSGYRHNVFTNDYELWVVGKIAAKRNFDAVAANPRLMAEMHEEAFATAGTVLEIPVKVSRRQRRFRGKTRR